MKNKVRILILLMSAAALAVYLSWLFCFLIGFLENFISYICEKNMCSSITLEDAKGFRCPTGPQILIPTIWLMGLNCFQVFRLIMLYLIPVTMTWRGTMVNPRQLQLYTFSIFDTMWSWLRRWAVPTLTIPSSSLQFLFKYLSKWR
jgi:hypothetical protein